MLMHLVCAYNLPFISILTIFEPWFNEQMLENRLQSILPHDMLEPLYRVGQKVGPLPLKAHICLYLQNTLTTFHDF